MSLSSDDLLISIKSFDKWLSNVGYESYDPYDIWGTKAGILSRQLYYKSHLLGFPFIAPFLLLDLFFPSARTLFLKKERYATSDAQLILAYLNLYSICCENQFLDKALTLAQDLLKSSIPGYSGYCWGYPFNWQHANGNTVKNTPLITTTPYCFEAFLALYETTKNNKYLDISHSIADFILKDLNDTVTSEWASAGSYTPFDNGKVINASAYRAMVLIEASKRFEDKKYYETGVKNVNFIIESQRNDGSWLYAIDSPGENFIDHFHTCFVLKNLYKINLHLNRDDISKALINGYKYYRKSLFNNKDEPIMYSIAPRTQIITKEMYNYAECITLCTLLRNEFNDALFLASKLAFELVNKFQLNTGHYVTRVFKTGHSHKFPFLRWPQAQLFYAMTNVYTAIINTMNTEIKTNIHYL